MYKFVYLLLLAFATSTVSAQNLPERSEVRKGNRQFNKGNYEQSIERYERALTVAPGQFEAIYNLGNALYKAERFEQAEQTMLQSSADSLRSDQERAEAFYNLGNAQFQQKKYKEALESYKQSLRMNPSDMEAKYNYAYTKRLLDQDKNGGGGQDENKDQDQQKDQDKDKQEDKGDPDKDKQNDKGDQKKDPKDEKDEQQGEPQPQSGISPQEQQQMLDAIQAQEDKTQDKLKEKQGVVVRGSKNW